LCGLAILHEYLFAPSIPGGLLDREALQFYGSLRLPKLHEGGGLPFRDLGPELSCCRCTAAAVGVASSSLRERIEGLLRLLLLEINPGDEKIMGVGLAGEMGRILQGCHCFG
jgi:hypothetical protein